MKFTLFIGGEGELRNREGYGKKERGEERREGETRKGRGRETERQRQRNIKT